MTRASRKMREGQRTDYDYDLCAMAWELAGVRIAYGFGRDGGNTMDNPTADQTEKALSAARSLVGCLDAPIYDDELISRKAN